MPSTLTVMNSLLLSAVIIIMTFSSLSPPDSRGLAEAAPYPKIRHGDKTRYFQSQHIPIVHKCPRGKVRGVGGDCYQIFKRKRRSIMNVPRVCPSGRVEGPDGYCYERLRRSIHIKNENEQGKLESSRSNDAQQHGPEVTVKWPWNPSVGGN